MDKSNWQRVASGLALLAAAVLVVAQSLSRSEAVPMFYSTCLVAVFGYLFLSKEAKEGEEEEQHNWWW